jgi:hypothetical protein
VHEGIERQLHGGAAGKVLPAELDAPVLVQDRPLEGLCGKKCVERLGEKESDVPSFGEKT